MRPLVLVGVVLIFGGAVVLAMGGISYTKERQSVAVGPLQVSAERRGVVTPIVGMIAVVIGGALVFLGRRPG